jgi:hypothetical protein
MPRKNGEFDCLVCRKKFQAPFRDLGNLIKHLRNHEETKGWVDSFSNYVKNNLLDEFTLTQEEFRLSKFFISSNAGLNQLRNPCFIDILDKSLKAPSYHSFRNIILPNVLSKLKKHFNKKLLMAVSVTIIVDIWTNRVNADFLAVGAMITDSKLNSELIVIGMERMKGGHSAENIAETIQSIVNFYDFDKQKLRCNL